MLKLTANEITFLRWLHTNGGTACLSKKIKPDITDRVIGARYVLTELDVYRPDTVRYTLTEYGREALGLYEK